MAARHTILVIDDDASTLEILLLILNNAGYNVEVAKDHNLPFYETRKFPDLIILDNNLGKKNGSEICTELKSNDETNHIPVIMISAMDDIKKIAEESCADDYIP